MQLPLFPLNAVLFPSGLLSLRVFEARYIDMVADCLRDAQPFGVYLATGAGAVAPHTVGCTARILSCDAPQPSLLHLRVLGEQRFDVLTSTTVSSGLQVAEVELLPADADRPIATDHQPCTKLLARILLDLEAQTDQKRLLDPSAQAPVLKPYQLDSSVWVGNRLCEVLQVPLKAKQKLMELTDATSRLEIVLQYLRQHAVI